MGLFDFITGLFGGASGSSSGMRVLMQSGAAQLVEIDGVRTWVCQGLLAVTPQQWQDEWGPTARSLEQFALHMTQMDDSAQNPERQLEIAQRFGYRDMEQWLRTRGTFLKYFGQGGPTLQVYAFGPQMNEAVMKARMQGHQLGMAAAVQANPTLMAPVEGVTLEIYAALSAQAATGLNAQQLAAVLAQHGIDGAKWQRVSQAWVEKMQKDTSGAIAAAYGKAFSGAGQGRYGAAGQQAAGTMGAIGGFTGQAAGGPEPLPFEKLCEIQGAMSAWSRTGQDVNANLRRHFDMSALDWSNVSMYWMTRMQADLTLMQRYNAESERHAARWAGGA